MKKLYVISLCAIVLVASFFIIRGAIIVSLKNKCLNVAGVETTFNQITFYYSGQEGYEDPFLDKVFNSEIVGLNNNISDHVLSHSEVLYERNMSRGEYWVQKTARPTNPVLFYFTLFDYDNKLVLMITYSIQSEKTVQTHDYNAFYEYIDLTPQQVSVFLSTTSP